MTTTSIERPNPLTEVMVMIACPYCEYEQPYWVGGGNDAVASGIISCRNMLSACARPFVFSAALMRVSGQAAETIMMEARKIEGYDSPMVYRLAA